MIVQSMKRTDYFGNECKIGDMVTWTPWKTPCVGRIEGWTEGEGFPIVLEFYNGNWCLKPGYIRTIRFINITKISKQWDKPKSKN